MPEAEPKIPVGISQCLLGDNVRYDGGHKRSAYCTDVLADYFEFTAICPEVAAGLGIPRPAVQQVQRTASAPLQILGVADRRLDVTQALQDYAAQAVASLDALCGYILMQKSPSCGLLHVPVHTADGVLLHAEGRGVYADSLLRRLPLLPVEEAARLNDAALRDNFFTRVYAYWRWQSIASHLTAKQLIDFYADYKYLIMAHDNQAYRRIGQLLAHLPAEELPPRGAEFIALLMNALKQPATRKTNTNVLMHIQGYFKRVLDAKQKQALSDVIQQYYQGNTPLATALALFKQYLQRFPNAYLQRQAFLTPYPDTLRHRGDQE